MYSIIFLVLNIHNYLILVFVGVYMYLEATNAEPGDRCQLISPHLAFFDLKRCLYFEFCDFGAHHSRVIVRDDSNEVLPFHNPGNPGGHNEHWQNASVLLPAGVKQFILEGVRGGRTIEEDLGDFAVDNMRLLLGECLGKIVLLFIFPPFL